MDRLQELMEEAIDGCRKMKTILEVAMKDRMESMIVATGRTDDA